MSDFLLPPYLKTASIGFRYLDSTGVSRGVFGGPPRTGTRGGDRLHATLEFSPTATSAAEAAQERRTLISLLARVQGKQHRLYLTNPARKLAGSFPATELLSNNTFANGTTGWTADSSTLTVTDRVARLTVTTPAANVQLRQAVALTQYAPYALRGFIVDGPQTAGLNIGPSLTLGGSQSVSDYSAIRGLKTVVGVAEDSTSRNQFPAVIASVTGFTAGAHLSVPYTSLARCALVDNSPNLFLRSDEFDNAAWTKSGATVSANATAAPDGTTTGEDLIESSSNESHFVIQDVTVSSAALDMCIGVFGKPNGRDWMLFEMRELTGSTDVSVWFNLSTGAVGTTATGANWSNLRTFVRDYGNGWYACYIVARKTNAATSVRGIIRTATGDGVSTYLGNGTSGIRIWRGGIAPSSVPLRFAQTTTAATTGTAQTGTGIHVKGLPVSTNGLLLPGDEFEVITSFGSELKIVTAALNSDAAGLGYLQFSPPIRGVLSDNAAVIIHEPMAYTLFAGDAVGWDHTPGIVTSASAEFEEAA